MKIPAIQGLIRRRILINYRVAPEIIQKELPARFRPKLHNGFAIAGICLIRLEQIRPRGFPAFLGINSENAAHRIAVVWQDEHGKQQEGVYIPRRDTNARLNQLAGGRLFPGEHHAAKFEVRDTGYSIDFKMNSADGNSIIEFEGAPVAKLPSESTFATLREASDFFEPGSLGYSATRGGLKLDGLQLKTLNWRVEPIALTRVQSSFFADKQKFPKGTATYDCALLMRDIEHEWHSAPQFSV